MNNMHKTEQLLAQRKHLLCGTREPQAILLRGNIKETHLALLKLIGKALESWSYTEF